MNFTRMIVSSRKDHPHLFCILTAPSWRCAAPESAMSRVLGSLVLPRVVISASIRVKIGACSPRHLATPLGPISRQMIVVFAGSRSRTTLLSCRTKSSQTCKGELILRNAVLGHGLFKSHEAKLVATGAVLVSPTLMVSDEKFMTPCIRSSTNRLNLLKVAI
jgi:hypothetical protein